MAATATTSASTTSYAYDPVGNLASVAIPTSGSASAKTVDYTSDGDGLRQSRTIGSTTTDFVWDTNRSLPLLLDDGTASYLYGPSSAPIAEVNDSTGAVRYLSADLIGSTRLITSSSGAVVGVNIYGEYGTLTSHTGTAASAFGYSGNWADPDTGLVYLRARDYDSETAQLLTIDPLTDLTRQSYAYAVDDPLIKTDPSGLNAVPVIPPYSGLGAGISKVTHDFWCHLQLLGPSIQRQWLDVTGTIGGSLHDFLQTFIPNDAIDPTKDSTYDFSDAMSYGVTDALFARTPADKLDATIEIVTATVTGWVSLHGNLAIGYLRALTVLRSLPAPNPAEVSPAAEAAPEAAASTTASASGELTTVAEQNALLANTQSQEVASAAW